MIYDRNLTVSSSMSGKRAAGINFNLPFKLKEMRIKTTYLFRDFNQRAGKEGKGLTNTNKIRQKTWNLIEHSNVNQTRR